MKLYNIQKGAIVKILVIALIITSSVIWSKMQSDIDLPVFGPKRELPIYSVDTNEKKIAISFDAAWGDQYTNDILDTLDKYNVKTTFFLVEFWAERYPEMVKEIYKRGHEIGNHSANHPKMSQLNQKQIIEELKLTEDKIKEITGYKTFLFRPPFGDYNDRLIKTCEENGYYVIQWDVDSLDWKELGVKHVVDRVTKNVSNGSIVLFHNNAKYVIEYLPLVLEKLQKDGYKIIPISELIHKGNFYIDSTGRQIKKIN